MLIDLLAGAAAPAARLLPHTAPTVLIVDSGLGGLTVFAELRRARPDARFVYAADDAAFPVGRLDEATLEARVCAVMDRLVARHAPDLVVIACNTISTLVLPSLRSRLACPVIGTVPPIKPAAAATRSGLVTVLATPGTVSRDYTRSLIAAYAGQCRVTLVGSTRFAAYAEAELKGAPVPDEAIAAELAPCFVEAEGARTDVIVLGCTHYPLLQARFERLAPWPVRFLDPAPAIARRMVQILGSAPHGPAPGDRAGEAVFTGGEGLSGVLAAALAARGLPSVSVDPMPLRLPPHAGSH